MATCQSKEPPVEGRPVQRKMKHDASKTGQMD
jgi:hypothetical protein